MSEWQPIKTYLLKYGRNVLGYAPEWGVAEFCRHDDGWTISSFNGGIKRSIPTHWMPLPEPPK